jgi:hypothetical protein
VNQQLEAVGLSVKRERFTVSYFPSEIGSRVVFLAAGLVVLLGTWLATARPLLAALCWGIAAPLINAPWRPHHFIRNAWPRSKSENILANLAVTGQAAPARVIFMAHYDTKSQLLPTGVRVALVTLATALCALLALLGIAAALGFPIWAAGSAPWRLTWATCILLAGLIANISGNRSPGALDNGSAVGTLLELARSCRPRPDRPLDIIWVATGAEEFELNGARHFLMTHGSLWKDKPTLLINLESVGAGALVYLAGESQAQALAGIVADELGIRHAPLRVLGAGMDHMPFSARRLPAVSLLGDVVRNSFALHSRRDNMELIDAAALERAGRLATQLAWRWAEIHQPLATPVSESPRPAPIRAIAATRPGVALTAPVSVLHQAPS